MAYCLYIVASSELMALSQADYNYTEHLAANYGKLWQTPVPHFLHYPCLTNNLSMCLYFDCVLLFRTTL